MKTSKIFNVVYYLNNTVFSFLLLYTIFLIVVIVIVVLKTFGVVTSGISFATSVYNVVSSMITNCFLLLALYQSFLALFNLKQEAGNLQHKYFHRSGIFFCIASFTNLLSIGHIYNNADRIGKIYTSENFYVDVNNSSLMMFAIGALLIFVSSLGLVNNSKQTS